MEGLWMGVPMVTLVGERIQERLGYSFWRSLDAVAPEWDFPARFVAWSPEEYVEKALAWLDDITAHALFRYEIRDIMRRSVLMDYPGYAKAVEDAYKLVRRRGA